HARVCRQRRELAQGMHHLLRRALEQPAAPGREESVSAEEQRCVWTGLPVIGNVAGGVARHVQHGERQVKTGQLYRIALGKTVVAYRQPLMGGPVHRRAPALVQGGGASDMIAVMMSQ